MCRLFGLHAGAPVAATFWLLDAPDSLRAQSYRNPDGAGIGTYDGDGTPVVSKQPIAAWDDAQFATEAQQLTGSTFVAHVRHASSGAHSVANTHPFLQSGRLFAHNGVVQGLADLDARLRELGAAELVRGETDSERIFALITAETARQGGAVGAGIAAAIGWNAEHLPVYAVNVVLTTPTELWALRYPDTHELWLLERPASTAVPAAALHVRTDRIRARVEALAERRAVVVASEPMDGESAWRLLARGELVQVGADLSVRATFPLPAQPARPLRLADLDAVAAASQH